MSNNKSINQALTDLFIGLGGNASELADNKSVSDYIEDLESAIKSGEVEKAERDAEGKVISSYVAGLTLNGTNLDYYNGKVEPIDSIDLSDLVLPAVTASDNGKILQVVDGAWALVDPSET